MANHVCETIEEDISHYLEHRGFHSSLQQFTQDRIRGGEDASNSLEDIAEGFAEAFTAGNHVDLFILWMAHVPSLRFESDGELDLLSNTKKAICLEFYLNLHFAIYPFRDENMMRCTSAADASAKCAKGMAVFRRYIEGRGQSLSQTPEFVQFYALPYIPSPPDHPTFAVMFTDQWMNELKNKLVSFVMSTCVADSPAKMPAIFSKYNNNNSNSDSGGREGNLAQLSQKLYSMNCELLQSLQQSRKTQELATDDYIENSVRKLNNFHQTMTNLSLSSTPPQLQQTKNHQQQPKAEPKHNANTFYSSSSSSSSSSSLIAPIDFLTVKKDLFNLAKNSHGHDIDNAFQTALILQALRWRFSRAPTHEARLNVLIAYLRNDILCVSKSSRGTKTLFETLLLHPSPIIAEYAGRFINSITTMNRARQYLMTNEGESCVGCLVKVLKSEKGDTVLRQQVLGSLQKSSLKRFAQLEMINRDVMGWIAITLDEHVRESQILLDYSLEYITALLMNLCLRTRGKEAAESAKPDLLSTLTSLLESENVQVRNYVNGTVYSLLSRSNMRDRAIGIRLDETLQTLTKVSSDQFKRQLQFILDQLISSSGEVESDDDDEDDEGDEHEEAALNLEESAEDGGLEDYTRNENMPSGEALLCANYLIRDVNSARMETALDEEKAAGGRKNSGFEPRSFDQDNVIRRAVTPHSYKN
ncbi:hypothetical protein ScalyP_jg458 [Parmales sp. scaly parma]|nr:hypothetical protein ScalyP_jg458 [Parmales sp. scaly parma]